MSLIFISRKYVCNDIYDVYINDIYDINLNLKIICSDMSIIHPDYFYCSIDLESA